MIMTGQGTVQTAVDAMKVGAFDYILKPFKLVTLLPVLARAMAVRWLRLQARQLSVQNAALTRQLEAELARAGEVQAALLPHEVPALSGFELAARCVPAREVGGDFYDWQEITPGVLRLTVGDIMGKGIPAALLMASTRATMHVVARQNPPAAALELAEQALEPDFEHTGGFVTLFHAELHVGGKRLCYLVAQGTQVVARQKRRWVDPHWLRGNSYLRIGWHWVKSALVRGWELFTTLHLSGLPDPDPCRASASSPVPALPVTFTQTICYTPT